VSGQHALDFEIADTIPDLAHIVFRLRDVGADPAPHLRDDVVGLGLRFLETQPTFARRPT
jgi:hypothetical protein